MPLHSIDFLSNGVKGSTDPLRVQGRALAFIFLPPIAVG